MFGSLVSTSMRGFEPYSSSVECYSVRTDFAVKLDCKIYRQVMPRAPLPPAVKPRQSEPRRSLDDPEAPRVIAKQQW
jgi:hypothetical protein